MLQEEDLDYRSDRALRELHLGLTASSTSVARSHLQLPSSHMKKVVEMRGEDPKSRPLRIPD